jgi:UDP-4-amino-4,6-dideoxy-N-acetyl-beta-L-altrosamine transaminase
MIPCGRQNIFDEDIAAVEKVLRSDWLTQGPVVPAFESELSKYTRSTFGVAVNSATSALHLAYLALGLGEGDRLWTSPNTFVATANAGIFCGATVDFVDIDPKTYTMSVDCLREKLTRAEKNGSLPKIVVPVHFAGQSCDMKAIRGLADKYGFHVVEDASHALGAKYLDMPVGCCEFSDIAVFSFHPVKMITTGEGGVAITNSLDLANSMRSARSHGIVRDEASFHQTPKNEIWNYQQLGLGFNYRMTDIQAALGISQLTRLTSFVAARREIAKLYDSLLYKSGITIPWQHSDTHSSYHLYPIRLPILAEGVTQRYIYESLQAEGVQSNLHYIPVYRQPYYESLGFKAGYCPEAERYFRDAISLPIFASLSEEELNFTVKTIKNLIR